MLAATLVIGLALVGNAAARPTYPALLPNGANVPGVDALGHVDPSGGGANNDFGLGFAAAGYEWTAAFCAEDSDGDGQTNGQELGDPCCEWVAGSDAAALWTDGVSHPGDADDTADASLWANVACGAASTASSTTTSASGSGSATTAGSSSSTSDTPAADSSASSAASTPTPTPTDSGACVVSVSVVTVGVAAAATALFA